MVIIFIIKVIAPSSLLITIQMQYDLPPKSGRRLAGAEGLTGVEGLAGAEGPATQGGRANCYYVCCQWQSLAEFIPPFLES